MKKHVFIILLAALLLICACVPTPDEEPVLPKNQDLMIQKGEATQAPEQPYTPPEVPERFVYDFADDNWTLHADAQIVVPDVPLPMVWVRSQGISQELLYRLFEYFGNGESYQIPDMNPIQTKAEIEELIQHMVDQLEDGSYKESDLTEEEWNAAIEELKKKYRAAPEEAPEKDLNTDGTYILLKSNMYDTERLYLEAYNYQRTIGATSYFKADGSGSNFHYYRHFYNESRRDFTMANAVPVDAASELPEGLSYADAAAKIKEVFDLIGEPFEIASVYLIDDAANGSVDGEVRKAEHYALCFVCRRAVNGAPTVTNVTGSMRTDDLFVIPWEQESFRAILDSEGFVSLRWEEPLTMLDTVSESTNLLPFSEIQNIAEKMLPILYGKNNGHDSLRSVDTQITSVRLELIRVREQNNAKQLKGILIPVWAFYGTCHAVEDDDYSLYLHYGFGGGNDYYEGDQILLCINAIDGTIIDPLLGY